MASGITICPLRSGSSGNAVWIGGAGTRVLIDAGIPCRTLEAALAELGEQAEQLDALLITHEHSDHVAGVGALLRRYRIPLYVNQATWSAMQPAVGRIDTGLLHLIDEQQNVAIGRFTIASFATPHDSVASVGYRIRTPEGDVSLMTDIGQMNEPLLDQATGSRLVLIEANYDPFLLQAGSYPAMLKRRVSGDLGHLSNQDCAGSISRLRARGTDRFVLAHLSKENNYPELALLTVGNRLRSDGFEPGRDVAIAVARRFAVSEPICL
jgi:phosphoribosyl 1,2-cyclic phosphodiesterase